MGASEIKMNAELHALIAEMSGVVANIEGMKADNIQREINGASLAWAGDCFVDAQFQLEALALKMRAI